MEKLYAVQQFFFEGKVFCMIATFKNFEWKIFASKGALMFKQCHI